MIKVLVNNVVATASNLELLTAGMVNGRAVQFEFTSEWDSLNKTALFTNGEDTRRVPEYKWENGVAYIPPEVLVTPHTFVKCGVYGIDDSGNIVIPTLWTELGRVFPSASPDEYQESVPPTPSAWEDLQRQIGNLAKLNTKEKDSLVKAINEVLSNSGGTSGGSGSDGFSPIVTVEEIEGGHRVTITDKEDTETFDVMDGENGYTPVKGVDYFDGINGKDGIDGKDGVDGYTPIKDVDYFDGKDGVNGKDGKDGYTPIKGVDYFDGKNGVDGKDGQNGVDGKTPIKGTDYFTEADKTEMVSAVISALPIYNGEVIEV